ncbi:unnamed protein product [Diplocarpon coronariae]
MPPIPATRLGGESLGAETPFSTFPNPASGLCLAQHSVSIMFGGSRPFCSAYVHSPRCP